MRRLEEREVVMIGHIDIYGALWDALEKEMANKPLPKDEIDCYQADLCSFLVDAFLMLESVKDEKLKDPAWVLSTMVKELVTHSLNKQKKNEKH